MTPEEARSGALTYVSRQWGVRPRQSGRRAGQDEAFAVTGSAAATRRHEEAHQYLLSFFFFI